MHARDLLHIKPISFTKKKTTVDMTVIIYCYTTIPEKCDF